MATENIQASVALEASTDLSARQYHFMKLSSGQLALCGAGQDAIGVLQDDPAAAGRAGNVAMLGIVKVKIGGTVTIDGDVASDSTGRAVDAASGDHILGKALEGGTVANTIIRVLVSPGPHPTM